MFSKQSVVSSELGLKRGEENRIDRQFARLMGSNAKPEYTRFSPIDILVVNDHSRRKKLTKLCALRLFEADSERCQI